MTVASFVQIRGSITLMWSMKPNLKWSPPVIIKKDEESSLLAAKQHFADTKPVYGKQYLVNLIDRKGSQNRIGNQFTNIYRKLGDKDLNYTWFDFHGECKKMKWENLSKLVDIVKKDMGDYGHFVANLSYGFDLRSSLNNPANSNIV